MKRSSYVVSIHAIYILAWYYKNQTHKSIPRRVPYVNTSTMRFELINHYHISSILEKWLTLPVEVLENTVLVGEVAMYTNGLGDRGRCSGSGGERAAVLPEDDLHWRLERCKRRECAKWRNIACLEPAKERPPAAILCFLKGSYLIMGI